MTTLVLGASENPSRYANKAVRLLRAHKHEVFAIGRESGYIDEVEIQTVFPQNVEVDTVTLYLNPTHQKDFYQRIIHLKPRRIIFNPGTENDEFEKLAQQQGIQTEEACTLVLLNTNQY